MLITTTQMSEIIILLHKTLYNSRDGNDPDAEDTQTAHKARKSLPTLRSEVRDTPG